MIEFDLTREAIDTESWRNRLLDSSCGGYAAFEGWIRDHNEGHDVRRLEYEVYETLARSEGEKILSEAIDQFGVTRVACVHRHGTLELGDVAVWIGVAAGHRDEAFKACRYIIDEIKVRLPIWKKEHYVSGDSGWVNCERCAAHGHGDERPEEHQVPPASAGG
jgi:molybdopterin synthase catalytic subunit